MNVSLSSGALSKPSTTRSPAFALMVLGTWTKTSLLVSLVWQESLASHASQALDRTVLTQAVDEVVLVMIPSSVTMIGALSNDDVCWSGPGPGLMF